MRTCAAMATRRSTAILLSGGLDSAVVMALVRRENRPTEALFMNFGQQALEPERAASQAIASHYEAPWEEISIRPLQTIAFAEVPGRNDLLLAMASAARPASHVAIGVHAGTGYVDCSPNHIGAWQSLFDLQFGGSRRVLAPLIDFTKREVLETARLLSVPLNLTWSCEDASGPCGKCASCRDRNANALA